MKPLNIIAIYTQCVIAISCAAPEPSGEIADTVHTNGRIYTVNETLPWAEAVAIKDGKFIKVGSVAHSRCRA